MSFLFADSFDFINAVSDLALRWDTVSAGNGTVISGADTAYGTGRAIRLGNSNSQALTKNTGVNSNTIYFTVRVNTISPIANNSSIYISLSFNDDTLPQTEVRFRNDGAIDCYSGSTLLGGSLAQFNSNWSSIQGKIVFSRTAGTVELRKNGSPTPFLNLTGVNTCNGTTNTSANTISLKNVGTGGSFASEVGFDDVFFCSGDATAPNAFLPDLRAVHSLPNASLRTDFAATGGTNLVAVAGPLIDGNTSFVQSGTTGARDCYGLASPTTALAIFGVTHYAVWTKSDGGAATGILGLSPDGTTAPTTLLTNSAIPGGAYTVSSAFTLKDPTNAPWTPTSLASNKLNLVVG